MIAVFDTNVFIAALVTEGLCSRLLRRARAGEFSLVSCPFIREEILSILSRKFRLAREEAVSVMEPVSEATAQVIDHDIRVANVCRDASDDNVLACALAAKADYLVTGDTDLLEIESFKSIKIITPRDFEALFV